MIKIGLVGEDPNDTTSIKNLLLQKFGEQVNFITLIKNKRGFQLDNLNTYRSLKIEFSTKKPDYVLFIRDADAIFTETNKIKARSRWFGKMLSAVNDKGILLMNIFELEALILADIETFNKIFSVNINYAKNVMYEKDPKEFLIQKTFKSQRTFSENDCPEIFSKLSVDQVCKNCRYFRDFLDHFTNLVGKH